MPVTGTASRTLKRTRRGRVTLALKLNKTGRGLLSRSATLPIQVQVAIREHHGSTLHAVFESLLRH